MKNFLKLLLLLTAFLFVSCGSIETPVQSGYTETINCPFSRTIDYYNYNQTRLFYSPWSHWNYNTLYNGIHPYDYYYFRHSQYINGLQYCNMWNGVSLYDRNYTNYWSPPYQNYYYMQRLRYINELNQRNSWNTVGRKHPKHTYKYIHNIHRNTRLIKQPTRYNRSHTYTRQHYNSKPHPIRYVTPTPYTRNKRRSVRPIRRYSPQKTYQRHPIRNNEKSHK